MNDNVNVSFRDGFRIMQLTDLHFVRTGMGGPEQGTLDMVEMLIRLEKPDFIAITGDMSYSDATDCCYRDFCEFMDGFRIPWGYAMGNHDDELGPGYAALENILYSSRTCLYRQGMPGVPGHGNYTVALIEGDRDPVWALYFIDTHADGVLLREQTQWYTARRDALIAEYGRPIPSLAFMHIPFKEYNDVRAAGAPGVMLEGVCALRDDAGLLDAMTAAGDMKGVFVGHDHVNDFAGDWKGVLLAYGRGSCAGELRIDGLRRGGYLRPGFVPGCRMMILSREGFETYVRLADGSVLYKKGE